MKQVIYKYKISNGMSQQQIDMPIGTQFIKVGVMNNEMFLWAIVDLDEKEMEYRTIEIVGTGNPMLNLKKDNLKRIYLDTVFQIGVMNMIFVWHIFEVIEL